MKSTKFNYKFWIISGVIFIFPILIVLTNTLGSDAISENSESRPIIEMNNFEVLNTANYDVGIRQDSLLQVGDTLYTSANLNKLYSINMASGELQFEGDYTVIQLLHNQTLDLLYVVTSSKRLVALNTNDSVVWENNSQHGQRGGITVYVDENGNDYANVSPIGVVQIDPQTGEFSQNYPIPELTPALYYANFGYFWRITNSRLEAREISNASEVAWISEYDGLTACCLEQVWIDDEYVILHFSSSLWVLSREAGDLLWLYDTSDIVSNFGVVNGQIFALDINANLLIFDISDGEVIGFIEFETPVGNALDTRDNSGVIGSSMITVDENYLSIYFGDTNSLSIFSILE